MNPNPITEASFAPTIVDLLRQRAAYRPHDRAFTFLVDGEVEELNITYAELDRKARAVGAWLATSGMAGKRVLLLYPSGLDFIAAFMGCLYGGAIAVPAYPPRKNRSVERIEAIAADAKASVALTTRDVLDRFDALRATAPSLEKLLWKVDSELEGDWADRWERPEIDGDTLAFLQYTSGSTGTPKGVMLSHGNLLHNSLRIMQAFEITRSQSGVFWLPSFHDMGLIGGILVPLYGGKFNVLMSPVAFLQKPLRWLQAISKYRATISGGPNFAYELCVRKIGPEQRATLDLSSWSLAFNGAEPVRAETIEAFCEAFGPCGFRREAFFPCYGLAESTLMVTGGMKFEPPVIRAFDAASIETGSAVARTGFAPGTRRLVGSGRELDGQDVRIVDPHTCKPLPPGRIGEIWASGPSVAQGYWNRDEETQATFGAMLAQPDARSAAQSVAKWRPNPGPYLRTGDFGFFDNGELFVTGRLKDLIIVRGRNHYPQDIEQSVEAASDIVRAGSVAAFSVEVDGRERVVVVAELERGKRDSGVVTASFDAIRKRLAVEHEIALEAIVMVRPNSIAKTSSGKIQRHACRRQFLEGALDVVEQLITWQAAPAAAPRVDAGAEEARPSAEAPRLARQRPVGEAARPHRPDRELPQDIVEIVYEHVRRIAKERAGRLTLDTNIVELGLDSLERMEIVASLEEAFGGRFPEQVLPSIETCREVTEAILDHMPVDGRRQVEAARVVAAIDSETYRIEEFPEVRALEQNFAMVREAGLQNPYFGVHEGLTNDRTRIDGREMVSWATYNYLGMSGEPEVAAAAKAAIDTYGTSVSASRLVSGEKVIHQELERAIAGMLGTEDAVTFVGGHATNETVIGHVVGPGDLVLHDSLAHNSLLQGAVLSGARRRPFPHNDFEAADRLLAQVRSQYRRVLLVIEGIYSMDGDYADLPRFIDVAKRHRSLLMVDEAHSLGVMGPRGRGIGEHFGVAPADVDLWMGTLSKALGSCGGYIAGSATLVRWLKYTVPGFVYSVGLPPAAAGAALGALRLLERQPERVARLHANARLFLQLAREAGLDTGPSGGSAIVPVILGNSMNSLRLSRALFARGINVQPILYPAVEERASRLRFFITSRHTPEQIRRTIEALREELARLAPREPAGLGAGIQPA
ncbi:MAG: aminotransferase class I/II-fold pyridoxal phosphate-dependent enzyme [Planctomycetia bacterium]|nr:aminotransferase class I/II-fold pyridoxal phosphate-dependent enzyme [Planctomycetia bacterium]